MARTAVYLGVDQTGAVKRRGQEAIYKPLPAALIIPGQKQVLQVRVATKEGRKFGLSSFDAEEITSLLDAAVPRPGDVRILVDCVLGLPSSMRRNDASIRDLLMRAALFDSRTKTPAGRERAAAFFSEILAESKHRATPREMWPLRHCERLLASNSVFQQHPFQKNIQSGTYRIWRDLGRFMSKPENASLRFWPHDFTESVLMRDGNSGPEMVIAEGYPSFYWRQLLGMRTRQPALLKNALTSTASQIGWSVACEHWSLIESDPDLADAVVLAMTAFVLDLSGQAFSRKMTAGTPEDFSAEFEGWIAGTQADFFTAS